jgi:hypothetical protein
MHWNVIDHPAADWTIQQCRTAITGETAHQFLIHDRDAIYAPAVDRAIRSMGLGFAYCRSRASRKSGKSGPIET